MTEERDFSIDPHSTPYTHLDFKNDPAEFQFALVSDNSGSAREGVFTEGLKLLNLLQPEFVVSLGDLIEGYNTPDGKVADHHAYRNWWAEIDKDLAALEMPFFFLPGNHDINNQASVDVWRERHGGLREYYHFRYKDVLFLMMSTEDPPKSLEKLKEEDPERLRLIGSSYKELKKAMLEEAPTERLQELLKPIEDYLGSANFSDDQVRYFDRVLAENNDARWTFVMLHSPAWRSLTGEPIDNENFQKIESLLGDRFYTVFAAHTHNYNYSERNGRDYIVTGMTGAMNKPNYQAIDHVVWVTMTKDGPKIANLLLNGIIDKHGPQKGDPTESFGMYEPRSAC